MITIQQILSRCTEEQLESILQSSQQLMSHMEFFTNRPSIELAGECEQYWKVYGINAMAFLELAARAQGSRKRLAEPIEQPQSWWLCSSTLISKKWMISRLHGNRITSATSPTRFGRD